MGRIVAIDYGLKRVGIAVTDPLQLIATPLQMVPCSDMIPFLKTYVATEEVETIVVGMPKTLANEAMPMTQAVEKFIETLRKTFPSLTIVSYDERYTSKIALKSLVMGGAKQKTRRNKGTIDQVSATILLQDFLNTKL